MAQLECIHHPVDRENSTHVIFVHGLGGDIRGTWMSDAAVPSTLWPKWVGRDIECPTWLLGYDAQLSAWSGDAMPLPHQGGTVLDLLMNEPQLKGAGIVLVGHSLGGLVIKTALVRAATHGVERYDALLKQLRGVVFIATPHFGAHLANLASAWSVVTRTNPQVHNMKTHDPHLQSLNEQFLAQHKRLGFSVRVFCETNGVRAKPRLFGLLRGPSIMVVPSTNANPHIPGEPAVTLPEDHFSICKPISTENQIHGAMLAFLGELLAAPKLINSERLADPVVERDRARGDVKERNTFDPIEAKLNGSDVRIVFGRIESYEGSPGTTVVLPCNEYFDDRCTADARSALGAYVQKRFVGQVDSFIALVRDERLRKLGPPTQRLKTRGEYGDSFGAGRCLLLINPLNRQQNVALVSTTTQRATEGLSARISYVLDGLRHLVEQHGDERLNEIILPVMGGGHGGLQPRLAFCALLIALAEVLRYGSGAQRLKKVTVVVFKGDASPSAEVHPDEVRSVLNLVTG